MTLRCEFAPSPRVVRWFKGRTALKTSNKYSMKREAKRAELTIHGLTGMDAGQYRCMAGGSQSTAHVSVEGSLTKCWVAIVFRFFYASSVDDIAYFVSCSANTEVSEAP